MKKSFILHYDSLSVIDKMTDEQTGKLFRMMKSYHNGRDYICEDLAVELVFEQFKNQFDRDLVKYNNICERNSNNGKKGGRPQEPKEPSGLSGNPKKPKKADNDSDNKNDSDKDNKSITKKSLHDDKMKDIILNQGNRFEEFWKSYPNSTSNGVTKKIVLEYYKRASDNENNIIEEVKLINWYVRYGIIDPKYVKSCNNWIISFKDTNPHIKEQNIKKIVYELMKKKDPEVAKQLFEDFGKDIIDKYVKEYNKEFNTPILK